MSVRDLMSCDEFHDMAEGYALSVLDASELLACAQHLAQPGPHAGCTELVSGTRGFAARLTELLPAMTPAPRVWDAIAARLSAEAERLGLERVEHQRSKPATHQGQA